MNAVDIVETDPALLKMRKNAFAGYNLSGRRGIEIGPLCRPLIEKKSSEIYYVDHCSTEELKEKYRNDRSVDQDKIVPIDFTWTNQALAQALGAICPVDFIVASHVIEHVPDLIGWLTEMYQSLREGGSLILIVPDKRFTFDVCRRNSAYGEVEAAYKEKRRRPGLRCIMDHFANVVQADCYSLWRDSGIAAGLPFLHTPDFLSLAAEHYAQGRYIDVHCWVFTPSSFFEIMDRATRETDLKFDLEYFLSTPVNDLEFYVRLTRVSACTTDWKTLAETERALSPQSPT